jgi:ribosomal protein L33
MSQDRLIRLVSAGVPKTGLGKGHVIYTFKNKKLVQRKIELSKYNPVARVVTKYKESKKK